MAKKEIAVKKYVVKMSAEERERLEAPSHAGRSSAQTLTRARILLKADVSEAGEGWGDSAISAALDTSVNNVARTRQLLVEEGFEATLSASPTPTLPGRGSSTERRRRNGSLWRARPLRRGSRAGPCVSSKRKSPN